MSTDMQLKGDSLRRQLESSRRYAEQRGLELVEKDQLQDIGISAFKGANLAGGAFGLFLNAIRQKLVAPGSFLLVESLDRLSRQEVLKSLGLFMEILNAGINIVTLADQRVYTSDTNSGDLIFSIAVMSRAHEESQTKSHRLKASWTNKRLRVGFRKLTAQCPAWLSLSADKTTFEVVKDRAATVVSIFEDSAAGIGHYSIARRLNRTGVPTFGRSNGWQTSYVAKILGNRAVIGEFQPHLLVNGERIPEGEPIANYFPAIVKDELFYRAQTAKSQRRVQGGGRKGPSISNIFSGLARCSYCKSTMRFENKGPGPKGGTYLVCDRARRGLKCEKTGWRYDQFEASFLAFVQELDLQSVIHSEAETAKRQQLENEIGALRGELASVEEHRERTFDLFTKAGLASEFVGQKLNELEEKRAGLSDAITQKESNRSSLSADLSRFYESKDQIKELILRLQKHEGDDVYKLRSQISTKLKSIVKYILIGPTGMGRMREETEFVQQPGVPYLPYLQHYPLSLPADAAAKALRKRCFFVRFKDETVRVIYPDDDDPLKLEKQVVTADFQRNIERLKEVLLKSGDTKNSEADQERE